MGVLFKKEGRKGRFAFLDRECLGKTCWAPGEYQTRGATPSGSRATGEVKLECLTRAYHGCPELPFDVEIAKIRKKEGWRNA